MHKPLFVLAATAILAAPLSAKPPREESPPSREVLALAGAGNSDAAIAEAIAAANAHPLGTADNPVRVGGPEGERAYLARLRCGDGTAPRIGARAEAGTGAFGSLVAAFAIDCGAAAPGKTSIVMDMYHEENAEDRAPPGFGVAPR